MFWLFVTISDTTVVYLSVACGSSDMYTGVKIVKRRFDQICLNGIVENCAGLPIEPHQISHWMLFYFSGHSKSFLAQVKKYSLLKTTKPV